MKLFVEDILEWSKFRRMFYRIFKETVEQHGSARWRKRYLLDCALLLIASQILLLYAYIVYMDYQVAWYDHRQHDIVLVCFEQNRQIIRPFTVIIMLMFVVFNFISYTALYRLDVCQLTWQWWYEMVVVNQDHYYGSMLSEQKLKEIIKFKMEKQFGCHIRGFLTRLYTKLSVQWQLFVQLDNVDKVKLFDQRLKILPNLSQKLRSKILLMLVLMDACCYYSQIILSFIYWTLFLNIIQHINLAAFSWNSIVLAGAQFWWAYYVVLNACRFALFFVLCAITGSMATMRHLAAIGHKVTKLVVMHRQNHVIPLRCAAILKYYLKEHNRVCFLVIDSSRRFFGHILFVYMLGGIPMNTYLVSLIVLGKQSHFALSITWFVVLNQAVSTAVVLLPLAKCCKVFHSSKRIIPQLQSMLRDRRWLWYKLKYDDLYGRLVRGPKLALSVGPFRAITYMAVFAFVFLYVGYLLNAFSIQIDAQVEGK